MRKALWLVAAAALFLFPTAVLADSIDPISYSATIAVGGTTSLAKTVTVGTEAPTAAVDVLFLADTTGSMGGAITSVRTSASTIMTTVSSLGDVQFGVAQYKDFPTNPWGGPTDFPFKVDQTITATTGLVQTGINAWSATGGNDGPESQMYALQQAAIGTGANDVGWRDGSKKIVVWFGDAIGHTPQNTTTYPGPSLATTIADLTSAQVKVEAVNIAGSHFGIDSLDSGADPRYQASAITAVNGGSLFNGISSSAVAAQIQAALVATFTNYANVALDLSEVPVGLTASLVPTDYSGTWTREIERNFGFTLSFTGVTPGTYDFNVYALVDGGRVATEVEHIVVTGDGTKVPEPGTLLLLGSGLVGLVGYRRRARMM